MQLDFDPMEPPHAFVMWLLKQDTRTKNKHGAIFMKRANAAKSILHAVQTLRAAHATVGDDRIAVKINELLELARDLHDYDPTSD